MVAYFLRAASAGRLFAGTRLTLLRTTLRTIFAYLRTAIAYPVKLFSPLPDSPFSNTVFIAYITETKDSGQYADSMASQSGFAIILSSP